MKKNQIIWILSTIVICACIYFSNLPQILFGYFVSKTKSSALQVQSRNDKRSQKGLLIANESDAVQAFLKHYGECINCNTEYSEGKDNLIGCVEYRFIDPQAYVFTRKFINPVVIRYFVSPACGFKYPAAADYSLRFKLSPGFAVAVDVDKGVVLEHTAEISAIKFPRYCSEKTGCVCLRGSGLPFRSGLPFIGCANAIHGPYVSPGGAYVCNNCECRDNQCVPVK